MTNKELCKRYPFLVPRNLFDDSLPEGYNFEYINGLDELPNGWKNLFLQMCEDIRQPLIDTNCLLNFRFVQIKEKYGEMRCYHNGCDSVVDDIIDNYTYVSNSVCECCGAPATIETQGYIINMCDDCANKRRLKGHKIQFSPIRRVARYVNGQIDEVCFDCSDIWNRLYDNIENV